MLAIMKQLARRSFTKIQRCIIDQIVARSGIVTPQDYKSISLACETTVGYVCSIVNVTAPGSEQINEEVNARLKYIPIVDRERRVAYAKAMLDDQLQRRAVNNEPMTSYDPMEILDYIRKETSAGAAVDNRTQTVNIFDFSNMNDETLVDTIHKLQDAIDQGILNDGTAASIIDLIPLAVDTADVGGRED
jgi:hypothetical protein